MQKLKSFLRNRLDQKQINKLHKLESVYYQMKFGFPAKGMLVIGVTGTKGKTTTCYAIAQVLEEAGYTVGMATTASFRIAGKERVNESNKSVLHPSKLLPLIQEMKTAHCDALVLEVTSHALDQHRVWGIPFKIACFTNLGHDHLDYHHTMENYRNCKLRLFQMPGLKTIISNTDDPVGQFMLENGVAERKISTSIIDEKKAPHATEHVFADKVSASSNNAQFILCHNDERERVTLQIPGRFNVQNALLAAALGLSPNIKSTTVASGLQSLTLVPGRLEKIETKRGFTIIIDYAHTPDSLEQLYSTLRPDVRGKMIAVFGATGDRDKTKRPIMGALASRFCDEVILTDEEPYTENPAAIIDDIAKGVPRGRSLFKQSREQKLKENNLTKSVLKKEQSETGENQWWFRIPDRRSAIETAILKGRLDDVILITGMGAQTKRIIGDTATPWNEREIIMEILATHNLI